MLVVQTKFLSQTVAINYSMYAHRQNLGLNTSIFKTIKRHHKPIPVDYLAKIYSRQRDEILPYLRRLEEEGLITITVKENQSYVKLK